MIKAFKEFNKVVSILMVLTMIFSISPVFAADADAPTLKVSSATIYRGSSATIKVTLNNIDSAAGIGFWLKYDQAQFDVEESDIIIDPELQTAFDISFNLVKTKGLIELACGKTTNMGIKSPVDVLTVKMVAKSNADYNTYTLELQKSKTWLTVVGQNGAQNVTPTITNGSIKVQRKQSTNPTTPPTSSAPTTSTPPNSPPPPSGAPTITKVDVTPVVSGGVASSTITETSATKAINDAIKAAKAANATSEVQFNLGNVASANTFNTTINKNTVALLKTDAVDFLTVTSSVANVTFDKDAIATLSSSIDSDVVLSVTKIDSSSLSKDAQEKAGNRPVYDISLVSNGKTITDLVDGSVKVTIPYTLQSGEDVNNLAVYDVQEDGTLAKISGATYDQAKKLIVFSANKLGKYVISFEAPVVPVKFSDVSGWAEEYVSFLAGKDIIKGKAEGIFAPNDNVTRAEFVTILARALGADENQAASAQFSDVAQSEWFAPYVAWASEKAIVSGYEDGTFGPDKQITREEMCTMIVRTLTAFGKAPAAAELTFADADTTSAWAKDSVASLASLGILSGKGDNMFAPQDFATRAETAKIVYGFYQIINAAE